MARTHSGDRTPFDATHECSSSLSDWVRQALVVLLALGLLPALVFSWIYELTPEGLKRDSDALPAESIAPQTARRMDRLIVLGLVAAIGVVAADRYWPRADTFGESQSIAPPTADSVSEPAPTVQTSAPPNSIAVLPFADLSQAGDQSYFSDGSA